MKSHRRRISAFGLAMTLTLALLNAPSGYTRQGNPPRESPQEQGGERGERGDPQGRGGERRADPCDHDPQDNAFGRDKLCPPEGASGGVSRGDFNGDGYGDLAVGVPGEDFKGVTDAGAVHIIYGSATGLSASAGPGAQFWTAAKIAAGGGQTVSNVKTAGFVGIKFGVALASGRFNGDEYSDLAIGAPGEDAGSVRNAGAVQVLYGSKSGLTAAGAHVLRQGQNGLAEAPDSLDQFGSVLNWGDFNSDGYGDLAVGVPSERVGDILAGSVQVIYGSAKGLTGGNNQLWHQDRPGVLDDVEPNDDFGSALAVGDFNCDAVQDLAVGVAGEGVGTIEGAGAVQILYGSPSEGLTSSSNQFLHQDADGILDAAEALDSFGSALAAGNFNGDLCDDLAVGVPGEDLGTSSSYVNAGAVNVIHGSGAGLTGAGDQFWTQDTNGIHDFAEANDRFGSALAAGDFNGDGRKDLAVGVPLEDVGGNADAGAVHVIYGSSAGLNPRSFTIFDAFLPAPPDATFPLFLDQGAATGGFNPPEFGDKFGAALSAWDFGYEPGVADLAVGVPNEDVGGIVDAGAVAVLYGVNTAGQDTGVFANPQHWTQDSPGIEDAAEAEDRFGRTLY